MFGCFWFRVRHLSLRIVRGQTCGSFASGARRQKHQRGRRRRGRSALWSDTERERESGGTTKVKQIVVRIICFCESLTARTCTATWRSAPVTRVGSPRATRLGRAERAERKKVSVREGRKKRKRKSDQEREQRRAVGRERERTSLVRDAMRRRGRRSEERRSIPRARNHAGGGRDRRE